MRRGLATGPWCSSAAVSASTKPGRRTHIWIEPLCNDAASNESVEWKATPAVVSASLASARRTLDPVALALELREHLHLGVQLAGRSRTSATGRVRRVSGRPSGRSRVEWSASQARWTPNDARRAGAIHRRRTAPRSSRRRARRRVARHSEGLRRCRHAVIDSRSALSRKRVQSVAFERLALPSSSSEHVQKPQSRQPTTEREAST